MKDNETESPGPARARCQEMCAQYAEKGYASPLPVLSKPECQRFLREAVYNRKELPLDWDKGNAVSSRLFYEVSTHPAIMTMVAALLGEDIMLWGASIQTRAPGEAHPWHSDIESVAPAGKTVSVWIGIENTTCDSALFIVPYSNHFGITVQEARHRSGKGRDETTDEDIMMWARERDPRSHLMKLEMSDGEALIFDGNLWHCSHNVSSKTRQALLLQYATPDTMIRIPDLNYLDWPFFQLNQPRPACLIVRGSAKLGVNRIVLAPSAVNAGSSRQLTSCIYPLRLPLPLDKPTGWKPYPIFSGSTADMPFLSCHVSVLSTGECPHPPHKHQDEEILLVLKGEVDVILPDAAKEYRRKRLKPGEVVYYPAQFPHTLTTVSQEPANYLMFKWYGQEAETKSPLAFGHFGLFDIFDRHNGSQAEDGFCARPVFEGPTAYLRKLHCHASTLTPGSGYEPHIDAYDVGIIVLEGEVETLGERVSQGVIFYRAGEPHGIRNPGNATAKYVVFEFHGNQAPLGEAAFPNPHAGARPNPPSLITKLKDPQRWKRKLKYLLSSFTKGTTRKTD